MLTFLCVCVTTGGEGGIRTFGTGVRNDMDGRRIIEELLPLADDTERRMVASSLPALDDGFLNATLPTSSCIWGEDVAEKHNYIPGRDWWYYRIPSNLARAEDPDAWPKVHPFES
jgi:hypothetical protein